MARGKRRAPVKPALLLPEAESSPSSQEENDEVDDADDYVRQRHRRMTEQIIQSDSDLSSNDGDDDNILVADTSNVRMSNSRYKRNRPDGIEMGVLDVESSDSSDSDDAESSDDEDLVANPEESDGRWGGRRRTWYGGDTHDYEIMEDDEREEALHDEEEEALRVQSKGLSKMVAEDFLENDEDDALAPAQSTAGNREESIGRRMGDEKVTESQAAPELSLLLSELQHCLQYLECQEKQLEKPRSSIAKLKYHVCASHAQNIVLYLALRSDPDAEFIDVRSHPVISDIVRFQALRKKCDELHSDGDGDNDRDSDGDGDCDGDEHEAGAPVNDADSDKRKPRFGSLESENVASNNTDKTTSRTVVQIDMDKYRRRISARKNDRKKRTQPSECRLENGNNPDDNEFLQTVIGPRRKRTATDSANISAEKRRKLNQLVGTLERERQNREARRVVSADHQIERKNETHSRRAGQLSAELTQDGSRSSVSDEEPGEDGHDEEHMFMDRVLTRNGAAEKSPKNARRKETEQPHQYTFDDSIKDKNQRRRANAQIVLNRGLTRYRPRDRKTPRAKNREAFRRALKKRRSVVRDPVAAKPLSYGGEASGINMRARKSSRLSDT